MAINWRRLTRLAWANQGTGPQTHLREPARVFKRGDSISGRPVLLASRTLHLLVWGVLGASASVRLLRPGAVLASPAACRSTSCFRLCLRQSFLRPPKQEAFQWHTLPLPHINSDQLCSCPTRIGSGAVVDIAFWPPNVILGRCGPAPPCLDVEILAPSPRYVLHR